MEILTFLVLYYHVFFISSLIVIGIDYIFEIDMFAVIREFLVEPAFIIYMVIEIIIMLVAAFGFWINSTMILSILWLCTFILIVSVLINILIHAIQHLFNML